MSLAWQIFVTVVAIAAFLRAGLLKRRIRCLEIKNEIDYHEFKKQQLQKIKDDNFPLRHMTKNSRLFDQADQGYNFHCDHINRLYKEKRRLL